jgi:hypothetical protein
MNFSVHLERKGGATLRYAFAANFVCHGNIVAARSSDSAAFLLAASHLPLHYTVVGTIARAILSLPL